MPQRRGTRPGETFRASLVTVWPEPKPLHRQEWSYEDDHVGTGMPIERPSYYLIEMRRLELGPIRTSIWAIGRHPEEPLDPWNIPEQVLKRLEEMRQRILREQRSERASAQMRERMSDGETPFAPRVINEDTFLTEVNDGLDRRPYATARTADREDN